MRLTSTIKRMNERVERLINRFDEYIEIFKEKNLFTGPSVYFHYKTLDILRKNVDLSKVLRDDMFFDYLYATLTSWGLHRMGPGYTKLNDIEKIRTSIRMQEENILELAPYRIDNIKNDQVVFVALKIWSVIENLQIGVGETKIVSGSKALHHILPDLIPPIDGQYTLRFFYNNRGTALSQGDEIAFKEMFPYYCKIASARTKSIEKYVGYGMNTSKSKVIDNAIVGFVLKELPKKK